MVAADSSRGVSWDDVRIQKRVVFDMVEQIGIFSGSHGNIAAVIGAVSVKNCGINKWTIRSWYKHYQKFGEVPAVSRRYRKNNKRKENKKRKRDFNTARDLDTEVEVRLVRRSKREPWNPQELHVLKKIICESPELYLDEIQGEFKKWTSIKRPTSSIWRALKLHLNYSLQVVTRVAKERNENERQEYLAGLRLACRNTKMVVFVDETAKDRNASRRRRIWNLIGTKAELVEALHDSGDGERYTMIGACNIDGFIPQACEAIFRERGHDDDDPSRGTVDAERFCDWVEFFLCPVLGNYAADEPNSLVVMDNCHQHHGPRVRELVEGTGAKLLFTARYSPDLNPIEYFFHCYKASLKRLIRIRGLSSRDAHDQAY